MAKTRTLTRETVVETAVRLVDEAGGVDQIKLSDLAKALDIKTPSLYNHIKNQADLRDALAVWGAKKLLRRMKEGVGSRLGRDALTTVTQTYRQFAHEHRGIYPLAFVAAKPKQAQLLETQTDLVNYLLVYVASIGLEGDDALHAVRGLHSIAHGFTSLELNGSFAMPLDKDESYNRLVNAFLDGLLPQ